MEFNDGSINRVVTDPNAQMRERDMFEFRACSAKTINGTFQMYVDDSFAKHRAQLSGMQGLLMYQFTYPDFTARDQADFFCDTIGSLRGNEMVMLDIESYNTGFVASQVAEFARTWLDRVDSRLQTLPWVYVPKPFSGVLSRKVTQNRIVKAPKYNQNDGTKNGGPPNWAYDVWQYSENGAFPGCTQLGDINTTAWTVGQLLARCQGAVSPIVTASRPRPLLAQVVS